MECQESLNGIGSEISTLIYQLGVIEWLKDSRAPRQIANSCTTFYNNLQTLFSQNNYKPDHTWNLNETCIQVVQQVGAKVLTKRGSHIIYNTILKYHKWLIIHCVVNVTRSALLGFYIFKREKLKNKKLQSMVVYGDTKECMDDKFYVQRVFIFFPKNIF
jgi:hypothetical protein